MLAACHHHPRHSIRGPAVIDDNPRILQAVIETYRTQLEVRERLGNAAEEKLTRALELLAPARCPECDGSGSYQVQTSARSYISVEMASDAGDPSLAGQLYTDDEFEPRQCQWCAERAALLTSVVQSAP